LAGEFLAIVNFSGELSVQRGRAAFGVPLVSVGALNDEARANLAGAPSFLLPLGLGFGL
jgi:hypothetical protein